ncbi:MAG: FtsQ-type POTRA domain-containing protein [Pseudomonadales bacterium]|nr:FtsQ-type POTRA domain-containing protein [Pseudomonadales bacterium]
MKSIRKIFSRNRSHQSAIGRVGAVPKQTAIERSQSQQHAMHNIFALGILLLFLAGFLSVFNFMAEMPTGEIFISGQTGSNLHAGRQGASEKELLSLVEKDVGEGFWQLNLEDIKQALETHAWVRQAEVRREWPNRLFVGIDEYVPVARWNDYYLLTTTGELIMPKSILLFNYLPMLRDQGGAAQNVFSEAKQIKDMIAWFNFFQQPLIAQGLNITEQSRTSQGEITLVIDDAIRLVLGAEDIKVRFRRLLALLDTPFKKKLAVINNIDLRYANGIAVKEGRSMPQSSIYIGQVKHH